MHHLLNEIHFTDQCVQYNPTLKKKNPYRKVWKEIQPCKMGIVIISGHKGDRLNVWPCVLLYLPDFLYRSILTYASIRNTSLFIPRRGRKVCLVSTQAGAEPERAASAFCSK